MDELLMAYRLWDLRPGAEDTAQHLEDVCQRMFKEPTLVRAAIAEGRRDGLSLEQAVEPFV
jgi:hypothetical protein